MPEHRQLQMIFNIELACLNEGGLVQDTTCSGFEGNKHLSNFFR
jgi:hypothetical protein